MKKKNLKRIIKQVQYPIPPYVPYYEDYRTWKRHECKRRYEACIRYCRQIEGMTHTEASIYAIDICLDNCIDEYSNCLIEHP